MNLPKLKAWVDPQATRHTIYLGQTKPAQVGADRLALLIQIEGGSASRVPLPRIDRIISGPLADWRGAALIACAEAGVPIAFAARSGNACGSLSPLQQSSGRLDAELTLFAESPNAETGWRDGVRSLRARLLVELWRDNGQVPEGPLWDEHRRSFVYQGAGFARRHVPVDGHCYALVAAQIRQQGIQLRYPTRAGRWIEVALDLCGALHDMRALMQPLEVKACSSLKLRAIAFEASHAVQSDTISWCLLILRRSAHEHVKPWL